MKNIHLIKLAIVLLFIFINGLKMAAGQNLGATVGSYLEINSMVGSSSNAFYNKTWLVRDAAGSDWVTARLHDGVSVDNSFLTPMVNTKTWWERDPYQNIQSWGNGNNTYLTINNGSIGIGTSNPQAKLSVNGNIIAKEIKIKTDISVPDYVFKKYYDLPSLSQIESYIKIYGHLPEIPSAKNVNQNGLDVAAINLLLLKKVEELTLHLIAKEKDIKTMQESYDEILVRLKALENKL